MREITRWIDVFFGQFQFVRKMLGGHWELWNVDYPVCSIIWHWEAHCSNETGRRPNALCRGMCICEDYPRKHWGPAPTQKGES